ncbi:MAG TPA: GTP-binding protein, partial [Candidatus Saccharimonadales bacterium]|nr:GTP-binding protein [Candidatus Saccharimonadales bacterium]
MNQSTIRNFCIIAHIDHGKSTLADRMMEITGTVQKRDMKSQLLDSMDLEREKGITIKLAPVRMHYKGHDLNLIDTPGHVDFSYEVSRSLEACEGAILVVDASQGIQAQTLANVYLALAADLTIIPVLNKIDLPAADVPRVSAEIINLLGCEESDILKISAKTGLGVSDVLDSVVEKIQAPQGQKEKPTRALIFDSYYDDYRGVILYVRIVDGNIPKAAQIQMLATGAKGLALEVGALTPKMTPFPSLETGDIGYIVTNLKSTREANVGDTVTLVSVFAAQNHTDASFEAIVPLPGYKKVKPFVYAGFFPVSNEDYNDLKEAVEKLSLSDSALQ